MPQKILAVLGLFSRRQDLDTELLPPPPPFPDIEPSKTRAPDGSKKGRKEKKEKTKIVLKNKEGVSDILMQASHHDEDPEDFLSMRLPTDVVPVDELLQDGDEISKAINEVKKPKNPTVPFWKKLFTIRRKEIEPSGSLDGPSQLAVQDIPAAEERSLSPIQGVMQKVTIARKQLENLDVKGAKETYVDIMKLYRMMTMEEQSQVYEIVEELYEERKAAEKMPNVK